MAENKEVKILDWDDEIENDGADLSFVTLEDGDYDFEVTKFERTHYTPKGNAKTPACNQADITMVIHTDDGDCYITDRFPLASTMEWKISAFFRSIGLKKHGEKLKMKWQETIGCKGRAHVVKTAGKNDNVFFNNIDRYIDPVTTEDEEWN